jgi:RNA polymerase sigma-70 factor (ECF subfamily)
LTGAERWGKSGREQPESGWNHPGERKPPIRIEDLYDRYAHLVYQRCLALLGNPAEAEDALQEVFVRAMKAADDFRGESSEMTWLYRISTNHCLNVIRGSKRKANGAKRQQLQMQDADSVPGTSVEDIAVIRELLPSFDREIQELAICYFVDGMNLEETARESGLSVPTVRKRLKQFVEKARKRLE